MPRKILAVALFALLLPGVAQAELAEKKVLTLSAARQVAAAGEAVAQQNQWNVVIAIVDDGGHLLYLQRMDDVQTASVEVAQQKARSAAAFRRPTKVFADRLSEGGTALMALPSMMPIEGGVPLVIEGRTIGAIGVSGVTAQQDGIIAQAGVDALAAVASGQQRGGRR
ncbi:heme-binding protein [soil metagenome]